VLSDYRRFRSLACVRAEAATLFAAFDDLGLRRTLDAFEATLLDVCSFFAIFITPSRDYPKLGNLLNAAEAMQKPHALDR
jgi:hypothetical protein